MAYKPIESYGVIGDMHTVALVGMDGSIDWCCLPHFDSPSVFAAILDEKKGGHYKLAALHPGRQRQMYLPDTNVLLTRFLGNEGVGEVIDFMPVASAKLPEHADTNQLVRIARAVRGTVRFRLECQPAFDYARQSHRTTIVPEGAVFEGEDGHTFVLMSPYRLVAQAAGVVLEFTLRPGETAAFVLRQNSRMEVRQLLNQPLPGEEQLTRTVEFWRAWVGKSTYNGRWREMVNRSALALKLLTFQPTGAIVAAPTTSLPEEIGGERNWDYRYTWIRDAAFTVYAFLRLGYNEEAAQFMDWLQQRISEEERVNGPLNIMYGIDGRHNLREDHLTHLEGYRGSGPVRVGNAAFDHLQLDIYGELLDSVYLYDKYASRISYDLWKQLQRMLEWVSRNWDQPDEGIWEVRGGRQHFTYSKMQCWVALDRGIRLSLKHGVPLSQRELFLRERDRLYETIMQKSWNAKRNTFVQHFGTDAVDAALLTMPLMLFLSPNDPRMLGTIEAIKQELVSDSLVHRYEIGKAAGDGLRGTEGTFSICSFWLVEALTRAGQVQEARFLFEKMLTYANHLGLYAEEIGVEGEALGNFPQAFTHLSLISAAYNLDRALGNPNGRRESE